MDKNGSAQEFMTGKTGDILRSKALCWPASELVRCASMALFLQQAGQTKNTRLLP